MKTALVYDRVNKFGGAEQVLLALHQILPEAPLYTSVYDISGAPWADVFDVRTTFIQNTPLPKSEHEYYPYIMGPAFETLNLDDFDLVITVTHEFAKAVITKPQTLHICYCLTPVSYLWSGYEQYFSGKPAAFKMLTKPLVNYLRWYDRIIAQRPDIYLAISETVRLRIKRYYQRESTVIYPPVGLESLGSLDQLSPPGDFYLIVSRLAPQKRLDIAVSAFNQLGWPLKIIGSGREEGKLKALAKTNIDFLGSLTDEERNRYYNNCRAVVIPGEEDFNLVAVEAQSFGKPVIALGKGGVTETVIQGKTGWFFEEQKPEALVNIVRHADIDRIKPGDCRKNSERFGNDRFRSEFKNFISDSYRRFRRGNL